MPDSTYLELSDDVGVTADGNLEPLVEESVVMTVQMMLPNVETGKNEPGQVQTSVAIRSAGSLKGIDARLVPNTRMIETKSDLIVEMLLAKGHWNVIDPPTKTAVKQEAKALTDAIEEAGTHAQDPDHPERG